MFNFSNHKQGGIRFIKLGRITISLSVTSKAAYEAKARKAARQAVLEAMLNVERACEALIPHGWTMEGYERHLDVMTYKALDAVCDWVWKDMELEAHGINTL